MIELTSATDLPVGGYANLGVVEDAVGWSSDLSVDGPAYAKAVLDWIGHGARIVGGCCGTTPEHIAAVRTMLDERSSSRP
jgi:5-methyltetrahydrofolate--homocysteine methyltransferase